MSICYEHAMWLNKRIGMTLSSAIAANIWIYSINNNTTLINHTDSSKVHQTWIKKMTVDILSLTQHIIKKYCSNIYAMLIMNTQFIKG